VTFLDKETEQLAEVNRRLALEKPSDKECYEAIDRIMAALAGLKLECLKNLLATSDPDQFEILWNYVKAIRDYSFKIIMTKGEPERDLTLIKTANELLGALAKHIRLGRHVKRLEEQPVSAEQDLNALIPSMTNVDNLMGQFRTSAKTVFDGIKNKDLLS
jgi:hypothetical protein